MGKVKFLHTADTHLGHAGNASRYNEYSSLRIEKRTEEDINVRQHDINESFRRTIDQAIEEEVDFVLHAGDLFDFWGYKQPLVVNFAMNEVRRLAEHNILFVVIIGNHDLPKISGKGTYLETLAKLPNVRAVYKGFYEPIKIEELKTIIHCIPSTFAQDILDESLDEIGKEEGYINIATGHFGVTVIEHYAENAINSLVVTLDRLIKADVDYFALGDYHETKKLTEKIWYSGSTERMGFGELHTTPKNLLVEIDQETKDLEVKELPLKVRDMIELKEIDAKGKSIEEVNHEIVERMESTDLTDKIVRLRVTHLSTHHKKLIDAERIKELSDNALYFKLEFKDKIDNAKGVQTSEKKFEGVLEGWHAFVDALEKDDSYDHEKIKSMGYDRLANALEE